MAWLLWIEHVIVAIVVLYVVRKIRQRGLMGFLQGLLESVASGVQKLPGIEGQVSKQKDEMMGKIAELVNNKELNSLSAKNVKIPDKGMDSEELLQLLRSMRSNKIEKEFSECKTWGGVYTHDKAHEDLVLEAYGVFMETNALYPEIFPALKKFEAEVVSMAIHLFQGNENCRGSMTSGGTESILMTVKSHRDYYEEKKGITKPKMIVCVSAHAAFAKAAHYFNVEMVVVPVGSDYKMDISAVEKEMDNNVILIVGSAMNFPHGLIDDIPGLAKIAKAHDCGLHVDSCLGSFLIAYYRKLGFIEEQFDFSVDGVTSISCDCHKYGYAPKGSSVVMYSKPEIFRHQIFAYTEWSGGMYCSPAMGGSRSGGIMAATWASFMRLGDEGFSEAARFVYKTTQKVLKGVENIDDIEIIGEPNVSVVAWKSDTVDVLKVADEMRERGWTNVSCMQKPISLHLQIMWIKEFDVDLFLKDLEDSVKQVKNNGDDPKYKDGMSPVYGMAAKLPVRGVVQDLLKAYIEAILKV